MKTAVLFNPAAGASAQADAIRHLIADRDDLMLLEMDEGVSCDILVRRAAEAGCTVVAAAGGDGTIHEVVNAILGDRMDVSLGVIPLGTGNDLARTLAVGPDPRDAVAELLIARTERMDAFEVTSVDTSIFGINAVTGGFSGDVTDSLSPELKSTFGALAYVIGTVSALPEIDEYSVMLQLDDGTPEMIEAVAIVAANGRTIAGGKRIASLANPQDGLIDVVIIRPSSLLNLADVGARLVAGNLAASKHVVQHRARLVRINGERAMHFNVDGEELDGADLQIRVLPGAISVVVGSEYTAEVEP